MKYYLAHPFVIRTNIRTWELIVEKEAGIELVNPFYDVDRLDINLVDSGEDTRKYDVDPEDIVYRDAELLQSCRGFIAIITGAMSYGTIMEIVYAYNCPEVKRVILLVTNGEERHPWLRYHATNIVTSYKELEELIRKI